MAKADVAKLRKAFKSLEANYVSMALLYGPQRVIDEYKSLAKKFKEAGAGETATACYARIAQLYESIGALGPAALAAAEAGNYEQSLRYVQQAKEVLNKQIEEGAIKATVGKAHLKELEGLRKAIERRARAK